ncbi:hypothetical protein HDU97_007899 [Phlyctochytrium planicorne]|nr:hypothetical protein HDU97_007899 [Phlyctochytrium planicorne]
MQTPPFYLFAYGSLMAMPVFKRVVQRSPDYPPPRTAKGILRNYKRWTVRNQWYPACTEDHGSSIEGVLIELETRLDLIKLDQFEGNEYKRVMVDVETKADGWPSTCQAYVYTWRLGPETLEDKEWSLDDFIKKDMMRAALRNPE